MFHMHVHAAYMCVYRCGGPQQQQAKTQIIENQCDHTQLTKVGKKEKSVLVMLSRYSRLIEKILINVFQIYLLFYSDSTKSHPYIKQIKQTQQLKNKCMCKHF